LPTIGEKGGKVGKEIVARVRALLSDRGVGRRSQSRIAYGGDSLTLKEGGAYAFEGLFLGARVPERGERIGKRRIGVPISKGGEGERVTPELLSEKQRCGSVGFVGGEEFVALEPWSREHH